MRTPHIIGLTALLGFFTGARDLRVQYGISISSYSPVLQITTAIAGQPPTSVSNSLSTYTVTADAEMSIVAEINTSMPAGITLRITLQAPTNGTSSGTKVLSNVPQTVVTGMEKETNAVCSITYQLTATSAAGAVTTARSRIVKLTLIEAP